MDGVAAVVGLGTLESKLFTFFGGFLGVFLQVFLFLIFFINAGKAEGRVGVAASATIGRKRRTEVRYRALDPATRSMVGEDQGPERRFDPRTGRRFRATVKASRRSDVRSAPPLSTLAGRVQGNY